MHVLNVNVCVYLASFLGSPFSMSERNVTFGPIATGSKVILCVLVEESLRLVCTYMY